MYIYQYPSFRRFRKCVCCRQNLSKVPKEEIVAEVMCWGDGSSIAAYYCNKECARRAKRNEKREEERLDELENYILDKT